MKKIVTCVEIFLLMLLMIFSFINVPKINNYIVLLIISVCLFIFHEYRSKYHLIKLTSKLAIVSYIENVPIYIVEKKDMGNYNVAIVTGKNNYIFAERRVMQSLTESEKNAIFYHELGHINQVSERSLYRLEILGAVCSSMGLYCSLYGGNIFFAIAAIMMGMLLFFYVQYNKVYREYKADLYSIQRGNSKNDLISALSKIQGMNKGEKNKIWLGNGAMKKRIQKIQRN